MKKELFSELLESVREGGAILRARKRPSRRLRQVKALKRAAGAWKHEDHPELEKGAAVWVGSLRSEGERRLGGATRKRR